MSATAHIVYVVVNICIVSPSVYLFVYNTHNTHNMYNIYMHNMVNLQICYMHIYTYKIWLSFRSVLPMRFPAPAVPRSCFAASPVCRRRHERRHRGVGFGSRGGGDAHHAGVLRVHAEARAAARRTRLGFVGRRRKSLELSFACVYIHMYIYICLHVCIYIYTYTYAHVNALYRTYMHKHIIYTYTYTHMYI